MYETNRTEKSVFLGIDTSNYTTSIGVFFEKNYENIRRILPVKTGEKGLRQSDALFLHMKQFNELYSQIDVSNVVSVGVSDKPRNNEESYMPCFLAGKTLGSVIAKTLNVPIYTFSHQQGHIAAGLIGNNELSGKKFLAFHVSGGTTELLLVDGFYNITVLSKTLDINVGQLIDRVGVMLGLGFPCGAELEKLSVNGFISEKIVIKLINGDCSLSGYENKCQNMLKNGCSAENIAKYLFDIIKIVLDKMIEFVLHDYDNLPILLIGGVMSNSYLREYFSTKYNAFFARNELSGDNGVGIAYLNYLKFNGFI